MNMVDLSSVEAAYEQRRYETARRLAQTLLQSGSDSDELRVLLHQSLRALGEIPEATHVLRDSPRLLRTSRAWTLLGRSSYLLTTNNSYRTSEEEAQGYTLEQYTAKYQARADQEFGKARELLANDEDRMFLAKLLRWSGRGSLAAEVWQEPQVVREKPPPEGVGSVRRAWPAVSQDSAMRSSPP